MKKRALLFVILFAMLAVTNGVAQQQNFDDELYVGINGGGLSSSVDFLPVVFQKRQIGVLGGVSGRYISQQSMGIQLEINYAQRGWEEEFDKASDNTYNRTLSYIEVPLLWHIYFGKKVRFIMNLGPQISYLLSDNAEMSRSLSESIAKQQKEKPDQKIGKQYELVRNKFDYGLIGGLGMELQTGIGAFAIEGRYYFGFGDIFENGRSATSFFSRSPHRLIEAKLSYFFRL